MIEYIYIVKCPNCEYEHFHFFDDAKTCAMGYISDKPIITQVEVERNDFGECTDSHDLGTVWSWEDMMKDVPEDTDCSVFTKGDLNNFTEYNPDSDSEFDSLDNSVDFKISEISNNCCNHANTRTEELAESSVNRFVIVGEKEDYSRQFYNTESGEWVTKSDDATLFDDRNSAIEVWYDLDKSDFYNTRVMIELVPVTEGVSNNSDNFRKPIPTDMTIEALVEEMEENEDTVECKWCNELFDKSECRYEVDLGYLCSRCEATIESRGETLTFREGPLDETYERDPLDHHDPDYNEDEAADYIADQNDRAKDVNFDIELSSLQESFNPHESVEFEYDDLEITVIQGDMDPETGTYDTCKRTVSYTYEQDKGDVAVDIWENFITEEDVVDVPGGLEALEDETLWNKFLETHFDTLFDKYYKNLLDFYRKYATSSCQDNYDSGYGNFDDFYSEDIDKNIIGHSMLEELEESKDYRNRLTLCPECGTNSFGPETCICMNCGFNTLK